MKLITLETATWVANPFATGGGDLGEVRHPSDGRLTVSDTVAADLRDQGLLAAEPIEAPEIHFDKPAVLSEEEVNRRLSNEAEILAAAIHKRRPRLR